MAYWVNREYYPAPLDTTCASGDLVGVDDDQASTRAILALGETLPADEARAVDAEIQALAADGDDAREAARRELLSAIATKMFARGATQVERAEAAFGVRDARAKLLPLPGFIRRLITQRLTRAFLRDVNDFFFHEDRRARMKRSLIERLEVGGGPFIVVAHSQGSMIAYDVLRQLTKAQCDVRLFVTIGSPLGLEEVQDVLHQWTGPTLPFPACVDRWVNVADPLDPVALDKGLDSEFVGGTIEDHLVWNPDSPRHPHSGTGYLRTDPVQDAVRQVAGNAFSQITGQAVVVRDLAQQLEDAASLERHRVLLQLETAESGPQDIALVRDGVVSEIRAMVAASALPDDDGAPADPDEIAGLDLMARFVAARLTRSEVERLRTKFADLKIQRIWRDAAKAALIHQSIDTIQVRPAATSYGAQGAGIGWAVLDTGISAAHPHFERHANVVAQWNCTGRGAPVKASYAESATLDGHGHGTHVAGTIAGWCEVPFKAGGEPVAFAGMAPKTKLYGFKVLDDQGNGQDSWIIKALDHVALLNERAGRLVVHGVNLSLGGNFDPSVYACGHTPLCQELRRLWNQGVVVCLAAGNEGYALLSGRDGDRPTNFDISIGDPANLEEAIAVGSIHRTNPFTYGVSYFSSRGPTADGRTKPDVVAPGEQILSAYSGFDPLIPTGKRVASDLYVEMSGTSMAAPHVSGLLAAFLSLRREFVGYPGRVKQMLLENCTDLGRDRYVQGRGMPNLVKMLVSS
jgi:subtilisin family serine protease